jgi:hypothetical protein
VLLIALLVLNLAIARRWSARLNRRNLHWNKGRSADHKTAGYCCNYLTIHGFPYL